MFVAVTMISGAVLLTGGLPFLGGLLVAVAAFSLLWIVSLALQNASIVDVFWGAGFILVGGYSLAVIPGAPTGRQRLWAAVPGTVALPADEMLSPRYPAGGLAWNLRIRAGETKNAAQRGGG